MKHTKSIASCLVVAVASVLLSLPTQAESAKADASVWLVITHKVVDYKHWKPVHERSASLKRNFGWMKAAVFSVDGDRNHIMVMEQFATPERARAYANSTELRDEMAAAGVSSNPEIRFMNNLTAEVSP